VPRRSPRLDLSLLLAVAPLVAGCDGPEGRRCVGGAIGCAVQLLAYLAARAAIPQLAKDIPAGKVAPALFLAALSISVGLVNAACMEG
jgi:hypothetical protein